MNTILKKELGLMNGLMLLRVTLETKFSLLLKYFKKSLYDGRGKIAIGIKKTRKKIHEFIKWKCLLKTADK